MYRVSVTVSKATPNKPRMSVDAVLGCADDDIKFDNFLHVGL